jgi:hypothetical protein
MIAGSRQMTRRHQHGFGAGRANPTSAATARRGEVIRLVLQECSKRGEQKSRYHVSFS